MASDSLAPFRSRAFTLIWLGALVSNTGTWMEAVALGYYVADTTGQASSSALVASAAFIPNAILGPIGSALADRFDRRRIVLGEHVERVATARLVHDVGLSHVRRSDLVSLQKRLCSSSQRLRHRTRKPNVQVVPMAARVTHQRSRMFVTNLKQLIHERFVFPLRKRVLHEHALDRRVDENQVRLRLRHDGLDQGERSFEIQVLLSAPDEH